MKQRFHRDTNEVIASLCALQRLINDYPVKIKKFQLIKYPAALLRLGFFILVRIIFRK
ncbi:MAG TPA: hypothetical protein VJC39_00430 [Candidatus Nanoarchaeia archaeon]|nr:hypothetical protein [Candidatus Nanoarchaeia archaeon]